MSNKLSIDSNPTKNHLEIENIHADIQIKSLKINADLEAKRIEVESDRKKTEIQNGILGYFFGFGDSVANNIAGGLIFGLILIGTIYTFWGQSGYNFLSIKDFWSIITPLITTAVGYLFGKKEKD